MEKAKVLTSVIVVFPRVYKVIGLSFPLLLPDAGLSEFVSAGEARGNTFGSHATRHARNSAPCRGGGPHGITRTRQRGGGGQPGRREQPLPVAMFPPGQIHPPTGPSLNHGGAPFFFGGGAVRCPPPPPVMGNAAHFWGGGQQAVMCPPPPPVIGSGAHVWGGGQHPIPQTSSSGGAFFREGGSTPRVTLVSVHDSGGRRDAILYFSADGNAGAGKRTGSSNHEKPHNSSAGQVRSGPVSAPGAAVMSRLQKS